MNRLYRLHQGRKAEGKAFTLLELIVVLLVLGVLAAIAVPTYNTLKTNSVDRSVNTTLDAIARAGEAAYISDPLMTDAQVAAASIEGLTADTDGTAGSPYVQGDRTITLDGSEVTVSLSSGTIDREGSVSFSSGVSSVNYAGAAPGGGGSASAFQPASTEWTWFNVDPPAGAFDPSNVASLCGVFLEVAIGANNGLSIPDRYAHPELGSQTTGWEYSIDGAPFTAWLPSGAWGDIYGGYGAGWIMFPDLAWGFAADTAAQAMCSLTSGQQVQLKTPLGNYSPLLTIA